MWGHSQEIPCNQPDADIGTKTCNRGKDGQESAQVGEDLTRTSKIQQPHQGVTPMPFLTVRYGSSIMGASMIRFWHAFWLIPVYGHTFSPTDFLLDPLSFAFIERNLRSL